MWVHHCWSHTCVGFLCCSNAAVCCSALFACYPPTAAHEGETEKLQYRISGQQAVTAGLACHCQCPPQQWWSFIVLSYVVPAFVGSVTPNLFKQVTVKTLWKGFSQITNSRRISCFCSVLFALDAVGMYKPQVQNQEEELQEFWHCHSEPVQGETALCSAGEDLCAKRFTRRSAPWTITSLLSSEWMIMTAVRVFGIIRASLYFEWYVMRSGQMKAENGQSGKFKSVTTGWVHAHVGALIKVGVLTQRDPRRRHSNTDIFLHRSLRCTPSWTTSWAAARFSLQWVSVQWLSVEWVSNVGFE